MRGPRAAAPCRPASAAADSACTLSIPPQPNSGGYNVPFPAAATGASATSTSSRSGISKNTWYLTVVPSRLPSESHEGIKHDALPRRAPKLKFASLRLWQYVALCVDSSANTAESSSSSRQGHGSMWYCALTRLQTLQGPAAAAGKDITERHEEPGRRSLGCILLSRTQRAAVHFVLCRGYCDVRACPLAKWAFPRLLFSSTRKCTLVDTCMCVYMQRGLQTREHGSLCPARAAGGATASYSSWGGGGAASRYGPAARGEWTGNVPVHTCDC